MNIGENVTSKDENSQPLKRLKPHKLLVRVENFQPLHKPLTPHTLAYTRNVN